MKKRERKDVPESNHCSNTVAISLVSHCLTLYHLYRHFV